MDIVNDKEVQIVKILTDNFINLLSGFPNVDDMLQQLRSYGIEHNLILHTLFTNVCGHKISVRYSREIPPPE